MLANAAAVAVSAALTITPLGADSRTFDRAYHSIRSTPVVLVGPGAYPAQTLTAGGLRVVFVPQGRVTIGETLLDGAREVEFRDMAISGWRARDASHVVFRRITTVGAFYIDAPSSWISVLGGSVGPSHNYNSYVAVADDRATRPSTHILIDGVAFHDVSRDGGVHVECLMLAQGAGVVIRNSSFSRCSVFDLFVTWWEFRPKVGPPTRVKIEGNRFGPTTDGFYSMYWADVVKTAGGLPWRDFTVTGNRCRQKAYFAPDTSHVRFVASRNLGC